MVSREISGADPAKSTETGRREKPDLPPEYCQYKDQGCEYAASCLACPFHQCLYDEPRGRQRWLKDRRNKEIKRLFVGGRKISELTQLFGVSPRTIQRALNEKWESSRGDKGDGK